jgi:redox-sensitive bicupin YhaK (pirin superfamily)
MSKTRKSNEQYYSPLAKSRSISHIVNSVETAEGEGFIVHRAFPTNNFLDFDPFLLLDEIGPKDLAPGEAKGASDHPHRGLRLLPIFLRVSLSTRTQEGMQESLVQEMYSG